VELPSVTVALVVHNRRDELRTTLHRMLVESDYGGELEAIVVDNASTDGSAEMVRDEFPGVRVIVRDENVGASAWNDTFAVARGEWILVLDDDCYLPADGLRRGLAAAADHDADLVSFKVVSTHDPGYDFTEAFRTGLLSFWGCAFLVRRDTILSLGGYDPEIFIWANELELMLRFFDRGHRHLHLPDVAAQHMRPPPGPGDESLAWRMYRTNAHNYAYIAGKLLHHRDAARVLVSMLARRSGTALVRRRGPAAGVADTLRGYAHGLRHRAPVRSAYLSRFYRRNFEPYANPWPLRPRLRDLGRLRMRSSAILRREAFFERRRWLYPSSPASLRFLAAPEQRPNDEDDRQLTQRDERPHDASGERHAPVEPEPLAGDPGVAHEVRMGPPGGRQ
jgi:GT2 family glycosyltransferase